MRLVIQRVSKGSVAVNSQVVGSIGKGFVILVGVTHSDTENEARWLANKTAGLRVFTDQDGKFNLSIQDVEGEALVISQFTLYGDARKGRRPGFTDAAPPEIAEPLVEKFAEFLREAGVQKVESGVFGAKMQVDIYNDGPVTIIIDRDAES
ncbi:MAG: D-aminoacyl-tRNA deacylase [Chloroflexi bacterium]|nr:D-aminoacyl-tRNA deacylase [Chloroflexota bacterium]